MCSHICIYIFCLKHYGYIHILCLFPSEYLSPVSDVAKAMETKQDIHQKNMTACLFALGRKKKMNKEKDTQNTVLSTELYLLWYIKANETSFKIRENYLFFAVCKQSFFISWHDVILPWFRIISSLTGSYCRFLASNDFIGIIRHQNSEISVELEITKD